ncbi:phage minor head protein [Glutamicibacter sp. FBE19]|uniref:phage minor head protein n=1 Tax=Glutamicibacter sp. FBE19 TaxID=2761534 RepID=UPI001896417A|nr:phage head morphogenesis protein [Glutamicibacter sp. FBE19]
MAVTKETLRLAADVRKQLRQLTDKHAVALVQAWVEAWDTISPLFAEAIAELVAAGDNVPRAVVARNAKLIAAMQQVEATLDELIPFVDGTITNDLLTAVMDAATAHQAIVNSQLPAPQTGVAINLNAPAPEALTAIVTRSTERIHSATKPLAPWVVRQMKNELIRGIVVGDNPRTVGRKILKSVEGNFNGGLARAMTIARTEMLDAHRRGSQAAAGANTDLLTGWLWQCTLDRRTCPSCLAKHGTLHPVDEFGPIDHQNGRCARVDKTKSWKELGFDIEEPKDDFPDARKWFDSLTDDSQLAVMGPTRLQLLNDGKIQWDDLSTLRKSDGWRDSQVVTPVKTLLTIAD